MQYISIDYKNDFYMFTFSNVQIYREDAYICSGKSSPMKEKNNPREQYMYLYNPFLPSVWSTVGTEYVQTQTLRFS